MADGDNITVKQFQDFVDKADERLDNLEFGKADRVSPVSITIPVSAWVENTDNDALPFVNLSYGEDVTTLVLDAIKE